MSLTLPAESLSVAVGQSMNRFSGMLACLLIGVAALAGCTLASGVRRRINSADTQAAVRSVKRIAESMGFRDSSEWSKTYGSAVLLELRRPSVTKPSPLTIVVLESDGGTTLQIGRPNDRRYPDEEEEVIARIIRDLLGEGIRLEAEMIAGVTLPEDLTRRLRDKSSRPNQPVQSNSADAPRKLGAVTAI